MSLSEKEKAILTWIDQRKDEIINFCCDLIRYRSVTGNEREIQREFLQPFIERELSPSYIDVFSADKEKDRPNITAVWEAHEKIGHSLVFNAHVDVVDVPDVQRPRWSTDPWIPEVKDGKIYGRGANDMKGGIAAILWAIKAVREAGLELKNDLGLELVVGEELMQHEIGTTAATKKLLEKGYKFDICVSTEPTSCEIHTVSCGTFDFEVEVEGKETHTANRNVVLYPQRWGISCGEEVGVDAIAKILEIANILQKLEREVSMSWRHMLLGSGGYPHHEDVQGVGSTFTINISFIEGGTYIASIPGNAKITCQCYYPAWIRYEEVKKLIEDTIKSYSNIDIWLRKNPPKISFAKTFHWPPYEIDINHPACRLLGDTWKLAAGKSAVYSGFKAVNDLAFIQALGIPGVSFGPGDLSMGAHGPNEYVPIEQLLDCTKTLALFIVRWCGTKA